MNNNIVAHLNMLAAEERLRDQIAERTRILVQVQKDVQRRGWSPRSILHMQQSAIRHRYNPALSPVRPTYLDRAWHNIARILTGKLYPDEIRRGLAILRAEGAAIEHTPECGCKYTSPQYTARCNCGFWRNVRTTVLASDQ